MCCFFFKLWQHSAKISPNVKDYFGWVVLGWGGNARTSGMEVMPLKLAQIMGLQKKKKKVKKGWVPEL